MTENETPKQVEGENAPPAAVETPITAEQFAVDVEQLFARARKAGLNPMQIVAAAYLGRARSVFSELLEALDKPKKTA